MKKHMNLKAAMALLLCLCLPLGGMPVLADGEPEVTVSATDSPDGDGRKDITVNVNADIDSGDSGSGSGVEVGPKELAPPVNIEVDSAQLQQDIDSGLAGKTEGVAPEKVNSVTVNAQNVTEKTNTEATGIDIDANAFDIEANVSGDVKVTANNEDAQDTAATAIGAKENASADHSAAVNVDGSMEVQAMSKDGDATAIGVVQTASAGGNVENRIDDISVSASGAGIASATGVHMEVEGDSGASIDVGSISVEADAGEGKAAFALGIHMEQPSQAGGVPAANVTVQNGVSAKAVGGSDVDSRATGVFGESVGNVTVEDGGVTVEGENGAEAKGVNATDTNVVVAGEDGNVKAQSDSGNATGIEVTGSAVNAGADPNVNTAARAEVSGSVTAVTGTGPAAVGISAQTYNNGEAAVEVGGDVTAQITGKPDDSERDPVVIGVHALANTDGKDVLMTVGGSVNASADSTADVQGISTAVEDYSEGDIRVTVGGNVESSGIGLRACNGSDATGTTTVVVGGTLSGDEIAVRTDMVTAENLLVTAWGMQENTKGNVAEVTVNGEDQTVVEDATGRFEQGISYIVKLGDSVQSALESLKPRVKGSGQVGIGDAVYETARQGEDVQLQFTLGEGEGLDALYYNETLGDADGNVVAATRGEDGAFTAIFRMGSAQLAKDGPKVRGAMLLGISTHRHTYEKAVTAPTCTEKGYTTYTCSRCKDSYVGDYADATGHDYAGVETAPTCTEKGYTTYTCSRCKDSYVGDYADATGHDYAGVETAPTCTAKGYTTYTCSRCGDSYKEDIDATGHNWGAAQYVWSDENTHVTATRVCLNDASHIETETAIASLTAEEVAKDGLSGSETYSATFNNAAFEQQTKKVWSQICDSEAPPGNDQYYDPAAAAAFSAAAAKATAAAAAKTAAINPKTTMRVQPEAPRPRPLEKLRLSQLEGLMEETAYAVDTTKILVYNSVPDNTEVYGVKASDALSAAETLKKVEQALESGNASVSIPALEGALNDSERARYDSLSVKDRLMMVLCALNPAEAAGEYAAEMSAEALELLDGVDFMFPKRVRGINGRDCETSTVDLEIECGGSTTYIRFTFYNDGSRWALFRIEQGEYRETGG